MHGRDCGRPEQPLCRRRPSMGATTDRRHQPDRLGTSRSPGGAVAPGFAFIWRAAGRDRGLQSDWRTVTSRSAFGVQGQTATDSGFAWNGLIAHADDISVVGLLVAFSNHRTNACPMVVYESERKSPRESGRPGWPLALARAVTRRWLSNGSANVQQLKIPGLPGPELRRFRMRGSRRSR